jgi:hypothetical protein
METSVSRYIREAISLDVKTFILHEQIVQDGPGLTAVCDATLQLREGHQERDGT